MNPYENIAFHQDHFTWMPLGGLGEVGMNCMLFVLGEEILPLDAGILFADANNFAVESVYPDFRELLLSGRVKNWLISHGHEDHIGAVASVLNLCRLLKVKAPIFWAPPLAYALLQARLEDTERYPGLKKFSQNIQKLPLNEELDLGAYTVRLSEVRHSTPLSCCTSIRWKASESRPELKLLHSGDFKVDLFDFEDGTINFESFDHFEGESPDILFVDSTNSERKGQSVSESELKQPLEKLLKDSKGRCFVTLFSSNLYRIASVVSIAQKLGKKVCLAGRSMRQIHSIALREGFYDKCPEFRESELLAAEDISSYPADEQVIICSGSQGEFRSVLSKVSLQTHPHFQMQSGDEVIFSSKVIPGNEKSISNLVDNLLKLGALVHWNEQAEENAGGPVHASGHARAAEIFDLLKSVKPKNLIPVHGNYHHLNSCALLAREALPYLSETENIFVGENYSHCRFEYKNKNWTMTQKHRPEIPREKFLRLENFDAPSRDSFLKARKKAGLGGVVSAVIDSWGRVQVRSQGVLPLEFETSQQMSPEDLEEEIHDWLSRYVKKLSKRANLSSAGRKLEKEVQEDLERFVRKRTGLKPLALVQFAKL